MKKILILLISFTQIFSHSHFENSSFYHNRTLGDINDDGLVNVQDIVLIVSYILGALSNEEADLNQDGLINVIDVIQLVNIVLYGGLDNNCTDDQEFTTSGVYTDINEQIYNNDESVNTYSIYSWSSDDENRILNGNGIPNHEVGTFPNANCPSAISEQNINHTFSLYPEIISEYGQTLGGPNGVIAYAINSVKFDPGTAGRCNDNGVCSLAQGNGQWNIEALGHETFDFGDDMNHAHVQPTGAYHYHGMPDLLIDFLDQGESMLLVGWASDGFPVYAEYAFSEACNSNSDVTEMQPSWKLKDEPDLNRPEFLMELNGGPGGGQTNLNIPIPMGAFTQDFEFVDGHGDLDECNGRFGVTPEFPEGIYYYMVTNQFPYFSRCLKGNFQSTGGGGTGGGGTGGGNPPSCVDVPQGNPCCGDGYCGGPENNINCPEDCQ